MTADDLDAVLALDAGSDSAPHWGREEYLIAIQQDEGPSLRRLAFVAKGESGVAGFAVVRLVIVAGSGEAELESIVVAANWRCRGLGKALLATVIAQLREFGAERLDLDVRASNVSARQFYVRAGFVESGRRRSYYRQPEEDAVLMSLSLSLAGG